MFPLDAPIGIARLYLRYLNASGWLVHRRPVATFRHPHRPGPKQLLRELRYGAGEVLLYLRKQRFRRRLE